MCHASLTYLFFFVGKIDPTQLKKAQELNKDSRGKSIGAQKKRSCSVEDLLEQPKRGSLTPLPETKETTTTNSTSIQITKASVKTPDTKPMTKDSKNMPASTEKKKSIKKQKSSSGDSKKASVKVKRQKSKSKSDAESKSIVSQAEIVLLNKLSSPTEEEKPKPAIAKFDLSSATSSGSSESSSSSEASSETESDTETETDEDQKSLLSHGEAEKPAKILQKAKQKQQRGKELIPASTSNSKLSAAGANTKSYFDSLRSFVVTSPAAEPNVTSAAAASTGGSTSNFRSMVQLLSSTASLMPSSGANQDGCELASSKPRLTVREIAESVSEQDLVEAERIFAQFKARRLLKSNLIIEGSCNYFFWIEKIAQVDTKLHAFLKNSVLALRQNKFFPDLIMKSRVGVVVSRRLLP